MNNRRRLLFEWWILHPFMIKKKPELVKISGRKLLTVFIEKHGGEEKALTELIRLNKTENTITIFCEDCGQRISQRQQRASQLIRGRDLCFKHQVTPKI